jgi:putative colanic acid biosynthesis UDP-glucose lipid carrier transferase
LQELRKHKDIKPKYRSLKVVFKQSRSNNELQLEITTYSYFFKRLFDFVVALLALVVLSPLLFILYFITKYTSKGPAFYYQKRIGYKGKEFYIFKFRSMVVDSEERTPQLVSSTGEDVRVTRWGRFMRKHYLDELPQLLNVMRGDMSVVGPRPERQYFIDKILDRGGDFTSLLQMRPGITSLGQIRFGYAHSVDQMLQRLKYEQLYLKRVSFWTDIKIIFNTSVSVIKAKGK